ncbi:MAG: hypothetical protein WA372_04325, partial [Candidatus Sulfotelmatobacter sp.]
MQREFILVNFQRRIRTEELRVYRLQRGCGKIRHKTSLNGLNFLRRAKQTRTPFGKDRRNPVVVFFRDKIVQVGVCLKQRGVQGSLAG